MSGQWYLCFDGQTLGPLGHQQAIAEAHHHPDGFAWREGFPEWVPVSKVHELKPTPSKRVVPPPLSAHGSSDEVDYEIFGAEMQYVEIELDPGESAVAEAGSMMFKDARVELHTIFGDGSARDDGGIVDKLLGAGKRVLTGENLFMTVFTHRGQGKAQVAFAAPYPGTVIPLTLGNFDGRIICQKDSFLCAAKGVSIGIAFQRKILTGLFGGEGFIMQKLEGDGLVFLHAGGSVVERTLAPGETVQVDTGCVVGFESKVQFDVEMVGGIKSAIFGGEGLFFTTLRGPGRIWLQSLPFSRLAGRLAVATRRSGEGGSLLRGLG
ncbi:MAG: TIGR00266 family protein [Gammaproteobacteria bacterium]|nr:TIGR00266 family protein [Gammaproteobacteria bacterium]